MIETALNWYFVLLIAGLFMIGAEIFLPGAILGILGGLCLIAAIFVGFIAFDPPWDMASALGILLLSVGCLFVWVKYFPKTGIGKQLTLDQDGKDFKSSDDHQDLVGRIGTTVTALRPSGIAVFEGKRLDVTADGRWVDVGARVKILKAEGFLITVREEPDGKA